MPTSQHVLSEWPQRSLLLTAGEVNYRRHIEMLWWLGLGPTLDPVEANSDIGPIFGACSLAPQSIQVPCFLENLVEGNIPEKPRTRAIRRVQHGGAKAGAKAEGVGPAVPLAYNSS